jgi:hypothetical protein
MKNCVLLLALILQAQGKLFAQLTLTSASYPVSVIGSDSLKVTTATSAYPSLSGAANGNWDMTGVTDSLPIFFVCRVASTSYQYADSNLYNFAGYNYQGNVQSNIAAGGIFQYSISIQKRAYSITSITTGPYDSVIINGQNMMYSLPRCKVAFPATYSSSWSSSFSSDLNFQLTFLLAGDTLAPGIVRRYTVEKDSVIGWGKMSVLDVGGIPSPYQHVLQVQTMIIHTDSFFLKGAPMSGVLLTGLHLTQGKKDTVYEQNYYREQEVTPLAQVAFRDGGYTQPYKATTHVQRLQAAVSVRGVVNSNDISVYPNPVVGGVVMIDKPVSGGEWNYELVNATGQKMCGGTLLSANNRVVIPAALAPGVYFMRVINVGGAVLVKQLEIR